MKLTDMAIKRAKPKEKSYTLADGNGLSLLVETSGSKGWRYRYQFAGKTKMISVALKPRAPKAAKLDSLISRSHEALKSEARHWLAMF